MQKILLSLVAALVALSATGPVFAAEPVKKEAAPAVAAPAAGELMKDEKKPVRKVKKSKKMEKKEVVPATAPKKK